jgi:beta-hydroxylase
LSLHPATAFKIMSMEQWRNFEVAGRYEGSPVDLADGFIHLSSAEQVDGTLTRHFAGRADLMLVEIDLVRLGTAVRWEPSRGGALFPHVYGELPLAAVTAARPLAPQA